MNPHCLRVMRVLARFGYTSPEIGEPNDSATAKIADALEDLERRLLPPDINDLYHVKTKP